MRRQTWEVTPDGLRWYIEETVGDITRLSTIETKMNDQQLLEMASLILRLLLARQHDQTVKEQSKTTAL